MHAMLANIDRKLRDWEIASATHDEALAYKLCNEIYKGVFTNNLDLWDERILLGLERLLTVSPPDEKVHGETVQALRERTHKVRAINDLFYHIVEPETEIQRIIERLSGFIDLSSAGKEKLCSAGQLRTLWEAASRPSEKITQFLHHVAKESQATTDQCLHDFEACVQAVREREVIGMTKALLVHRQVDKGMQIPVSVQVQHGTGQVRTMTQATKTFSTAVERARSALVKGGFITPSQDVLLTLDLTEAEYSGSSIALGAAMAIYSSARGYCLDTYTAYTGDINLQGSEWVIQAVDGIKAKLSAALEAGCRRVFIPRDNEADIPPELRDKLNIVPVGNIAEVLVRLFLPKTGMPGETLQVRKINRLHAECTDRGWQISTPRLIQSGLQFTISPPTPPELKVNIFQTGKHVPNQHEVPQFQPIISALGELDTQQLIPQSLQEVFTIRDAELRREIQSALHALSPTETRTEQYCEYSFRFEEGAEHLVIKQYTSGKLQVQGYAGQLYKRVLEVIVSKFKLHYPKVEMDVQSLLAKPGFTTADAGVTAQAATLAHGDEAEIPFPYIGTDESGKGDYFGPMVVAAVWLDEPTQKKLEAIGVRDSKALSDKRCRELASSIRELCPSKHVEIVIMPERYNSLHEQLTAEKKNLNHLLAWGHARALENMLSRQGSDYAVADQFGDQKYLESKLMEKGRTIHLVQTPKAERYIAVAAASVLARDLFLTRLEQLGNQFGVLLSKGASSTVDEAAQTIVKQGGAQALRQVAKIHFKNTAHILGQ